MSQKLGPSAVSRGIDFDPVFLERWYDSRDPLNPHGTPMNGPDPLPPLEGYAAWSSCYDKDGNPLIPMEGPAVLDLLGPVEGCTILDLGCGTGRHALALADLGARVIALDQSEPMLDRAKAKPGSDRIQWGRYALPDPLPFPDQTFDHAILGLVAEHIADMGPVFADLARVIRPNGRCILSMLHPDRTAEGQQARFIVPGGEVRQSITTYHRTKDDYHRLALAAGWTLFDERDLVVPISLARIYPRAERYIGRPLGWVVAWRRGS